MDAMTVDAHIFGHVFHFSKRCSLRPRDARQSAENAGQTRDAILFHYLYDIEACWCRD